MELQSLLNLLSDGEVHSGSELGRILGVSRTAIWKALGHLEELGVIVESIKGRGYRLSCPVELLDVSLIESYVQVEVREKISLDVLLQTESTNTHLLSKQVAEKPYDCCLAEYQTSGRGRRGRKWVSPFARNIYLSMAFDLDGGADALSGLSLVVGLSVVNALKDKGLADVELKWPNDVWLHGRKLAGILVELSGEATTAWRVVLGLGLNVSMSQEEAKGIEQPWVSLDEVLSISRNELAACLIERLVYDLSRFKKAGFSGFLSAWDACDGLKGKAISVNDGVIQGVARGVDVHGALLVERDGVISPINAGEVSVRSV